MLIVGQSYEWYLPEIIEGNYAFEQVQVLPDDALNPYISFDQIESSIKFTGDSSSEVLIGQFLQIVVKLVDVEDFLKIYTIHIEIEK